jgi:tRNA modification GTPase
LRYPDSDEILDEVLITCFEAPHSLTGEDVVEISCHGSPVIVRQLIDATLELGAVLAGPGEFTLRALSNGKITLAQAEAVRDLISSQTSAAVRQASRQLEGELSKTLEPFKEKLLNVIVLLESAVEFVEDDLPAVEVTRIQDSLASVLDGVEQLKASHRTGRLLQDGARVAITGRPNVGKSSLFNSLVQHERAIVTEHPGTTRDTLSEGVDLDGIPVILTDTAGLRETADGIEALGIERTHRAMGDADLLLVVLDGSQAVGPPEIQLLSETLDRQRLIVINKCDVEGFRGDEGWNQVDTGISISARTGEGLDSLRAGILASLAGDGMEADGLLITNARHFDLLCGASREIRSAIDELGARRGEELILVPLHNALRLLGQITGETTTEDLLSEIFATFCIGK